jgi:hypothetical protein
VRMTCSQCNRTARVTDSDFPRWIASSSVWYCPECFVDMSEHYEQLTLDLVLDER